VRPHSEAGGPAADEATVHRPGPVAGPSDRVREWIDWFGVARLVTSAAAVVVVCVGAWWLVRTPTPPPESALPTAAAGSSVPAATLPPPVPAVASVPAPEGDVGSGAVVVHVAGAVLAPGVYVVDAGDRVADAIAAAGGSTVDADVGSVNLAAPLIDGSRIYLPEFGEEVVAPVTQAVATRAEGEAVAGPVDVNTADLGELEQLPGVGPATAQAIVAERDRNGPFVSFGDLERVPGIGPAKLAALDGLVVT